MSQKNCRCETSISPLILDGYACGRPECWRTVEAERSFKSFVADLIVKRDAGAPAAVPPTPAD